jgi:hypothetical protein
MQLWHEDSIVIGKFLKMFEGGKEFLYFGFERTNCIGKLV